jgi:hypothetical protein
MIVLQKIHTMDGVWFFWKKCCIRSTNALA